MIEFSCPSSLRYVGCKCLLAFLLNAHANELVLRLVFSRARLEFYQSRGWYKRDFSYSGTDRTDWWGDVPRARQNSAPVLPPALRVKLSDIRFQKLYPPFTFRQSYGWLAC